MNRGDGLASGQKSASFTAADKKMTKEQWAAMFEPEPVSVEVQRLADEEAQKSEPVKETQRI